MYGRVRPSRSTFQMPEMSIDARALLDRDVLEVDAPVVRVGGRRSVAGLAEGVADEQFLAGHDDVLAAVLLADLDGVLLEPLRVSQKVVPADLHRGPLFRGQFLFGDRKCWLRHDRTSVVVDHTVPLCSRASIG